MGEDGARPAFGLATVNGWRFSPSYGLGLGVEYNSFAGMGAFPIYLSNHVYFVPNSKISPTLVANVGYGLGNMQFFPNDPVVERIRPLTMGEVGVGFDYMLGKRASLRFDCGYRLQVAEVILEWPYSNINGQPGAVNINMLFAKLGASF